MASLNPQDSYEQLKRKNRRRLVGAVAMVAAAAALLLSVLNQNKTPANQQQEVVITGLNADASAISVSTGSDVVAASDSSADLAPGTVLEPQPEPEHQAASQAAPTIAAKPAPVSSGSLPPVVVAKPTATPSQQTPVQAETRVQTPSSSAKPQPSTPARSETASKPETKPEIKPETKPAAQPTPPARPATNTAAKPAAPKPATGTPGKLSPQEILNNKAAAQAPAAPKPNPQAILDGRQNNGKALIQVGAYTSEAQARTVQQKLAAAGVSANISQSETSKGTLYRVRTGTYASRAQAEQNLNRIRAQGLDGMVIGQ